MRGAWMLALALSGLIGVAVTLAEVAVATPTAPPSQPGPRSAPIRPRSGSTAYIYFGAPRHASGPTIYTPFQPVRRPLRHGSASQQIVGAIQAICDGPTPTERAAGLVSWIPPGCAVRRAWLTDGDLHLDMSPNWDKINGNTAVAHAGWQIQLTVEQWPGIQRVWFYREGVYGQEWSWEGAGNPLVLDLQRPPGFHVLPPLPPSAAGSPDTNMQSAPPGGSP